MSSCLSFWSCVRRCLETHFLNERGSTWYFSTAECHISMKFEGAGLKSLCETPASTVVKLKVWPVLPLRQNPPYLKLVDRIREVRTKKIYQKSSSCSHLAWKLKSKSSPSSFSHPRLRTKEISRGYLIKRPQYFV